MNHTPGPWEAVKSVTAPIYYIQSRDGQVATTYGEQDFYNRQLPNARLIAAAPELLEVARAALSFIDDDAGPYPQPGGYTTSEMKRALRAVIAKAGGQA